MNDAEAARLIVHLSQMDSYPWDEVKQEAWTLQIRGWEFTAAANAVKSLVDSGNKLEFKALKGFYDANVASNVVPLRKYPRNDGGQCIECDGAGFIETDTSGVVVKCGTCEGARPYSSDRSDGESYASWLDRVDGHGAADRVRALIRKFRGQMSTNALDDRALRERNLRAKAEREGRPFDPSEVTDHPEDGTPWPLRIATFIEQ